MQKINVNYLYVELTRRCTLECVHCLREDKDKLISVMMF